MPTKKGGLVLKDFFSKTYVLFRYMSFADNQQISKKPYLYFLIIEMTENILIFRLGESDRSTFIDVAIKEKFLENLQSNENEALIVFYKKFTTKDVQKKKT